MPSPSPHLNDAMTAEADTGKPPAASSGRWPLAGVRSEMDASDVIYLHCAGAGLLAGSEGGARAAGRLAADRTARFRLGRR
jgi:hypothetical protein